MFLGFAGAALNGAIMPAWTVIFGRLLNSFGENTDLNELQDEVNKYVLMFVYIGAITLVLSYLQVACWSLTGEFGWRTAASCLSNSRSGAHLYIHECLAHGCLRIQLSDGDTWTCPMLAQRCARRAVFGTDTWRSCSDKCVSVWSREPCSCGCL